MRRYFLPFRPRLLSASRFRREDRSLYQHSSVANHVLLAYIRDHTIYVTGTAVARQVSAVHHGPGRVECRRYHCHSEHSLPETEYPQNGAVGEKIFHKDAAAVAVDASAQRFAA